jgi:uncharacterized protein
VVIRVSEIPDQGIRVEGAEAFPHPFQDPAWKLEAVSLFVQRDGDVVLVSGHIEARIPQLCGRCLEAYEVTVTPAVDARFVPAPSARGEEHERELGADDLETDIYANGVLDLAALLETETTLVLPMKPLCRETCRGLCPICGGNRNIAACACERRATDPRWEPLKAWAERPSNR